MIHAKLDIDTIVQITGLSVEEIQSLKHEQ
jgi:hypothetical protein